MSRSITFPASLGEQVLRYQTVRWLLGLLSLVVIPWFVFFPFWLVGGVFIVLLWRLAVNEWYFKVPRLSHSLLFAGVLFVLYIAFHGYDAYAAWLHLIVAALWLIFSACVVSMRTHHDSILVTLLAFMLIGSTVLFNTHKLVNIYILLASTAMTFALFLLTRYQLQVRPKQLLEHSLWLLLSALPLAMLLFLIFPNVSKPLFMNQDDYAERATMGVSSTIAPGMITEMVRSDEVVFRVRFEGEQPNMRDLYWRGPVFWDYDGEHWHVAHRTSAMQVVDESDTLPAYTPYTYRMYIRPQTHPWLFPLDVPLHSVVGTYLTADQQLLLDGGDGESMTSQRFDLRSVSSRVLADAKAVLSEEERQRALALSTEYGVKDTNVRARELVKDWQEKANSDEELANAALDFFKYGEFRYSLNPEAWPNLGGIDAFLFHQKEGFCEHFSISFTYLMRLAGIPARIVSGYQGGEYNALADYYVIRQSDAHSWVELWLEGKGWQRYDVVEYIVSERIQSGMSAALLGGDILHTENLLRYGLSYPYLITDTFSYYWQFLLSDFSLSNIFYFGGIISGSLFLFLIIIFLLTTLVIWAFYVLAVRFPKAEEKNELSEIYALFCERLASINFPREEHETPMSYARRVIHKRPDLEENLLTIILLYNTCRYSHKPNIQLLEQLKESVKAFKPTENPK